MSHFEARLVFLGFGLTLMCPGYYLKEHGGRWAFSLLCREMFSSLIPHTPCHEFSRLSFLLLLMKVVGAQLAGCWLACSAISKLCGPEGEASFIDHSLPGPQGVRDQWASVR